MGVETVEKLVDMLLENRPKLVQSLTGFLLDLEEPRFLIALELARFRRRTDLIHFTLQRSTTGGPVMRCSVDLQNLLRRQ